MKNKQKEFIGFGYLSDKQRIVRLTLKRIQRLFTLDGTCKMSFNFYFERIVANIIRKVEKVSNFIIPGPYFIKETISAKISFKPSNTNIKPRPSTMVMVCTLKK